MATAAPARGEEAGLQMPPDRLADTDVADGASASVRVVGEFDGWAPELIALITDNDTAPVMRALYALPAGRPSAG